MGDAYRRAVRPFRQPPPGGPPTKEGEAAFRLIGFRPFFPAAPFDDRSQINAHIIELPAQVADGVEPTAYERGGGDYFEVWLHWLPRVGDLVKLDSRINAAKGCEQRRRYEVVRVVHVLADVFEDAESPHERRGPHFVEMYVKLSSDPLLAREEDADELPDDNDPPA